ncbi:MAG: heme ABC transporter ATP-binding protein [Epulopiscium sp. Nele67-Bin005]|nr:MAG: heme ABC transporter ATP-binding protein [Epulopiscium sp. Nele67-Bin005]
MKKPVIEFENFNFQYKAQKSPTLKNINLTIYEGEKIVIVGPSGSGKSTLSHCINGLVPFYYDGKIDGKLTIMGKETKNSSIAKISNDVGTVLQDPDGQFIGLTVGEDIAFKLENDCIPQDVMKQKVEQASKLVDINSHLDVAPHQLSGGQKQRVTLAGVLVRDVPILLFDEPLASLDPATGKTAMELIDTIRNNEQKTIIIIEHRLEDVLHCKVDRIIIVNDGEIIADASPNEILAQNILTETGIREPLYITALKYANCKLDSKMELEDLEKLNLGEAKAQLEKWEQAINKEETPTKQVPLLGFENVKFGYSKKKEILKDVSFTIYKGEMLSVVGRNGAGKSTLSKLICGFYKPTSGKILFDGKDIAPLTIKERAEKIGIVLQNPNQMISKTLIFDEVALGLKIRNVNEEEIKERVFETLKVCGLYAYRNWPISALSFGQKKRVTIASILVLNPELLILDEPTAGQDFKHYTEIMEFLKELNSKGTTIIMITHDMHLMLEYTDRAIVISDGQKLAETHTYEVLTNYELIEPAHLKETSLYTLAVKAGLNSPKTFVKSFIQYDRGLRQ